MTYTRRLLRLLPPLAILAACAPAARTRTSVPPPAPAADASAADDEWVERTLAGLSLREKVGQMVMPWVGADYTAVDSRQFDALREWVEGEGIGGVVMSVGLPHSYAAKLNALQSIARVPLLVASDMENGPGMRMAGIYSFPHLLPQGGGTDFPPLMALGAAGSDSLAYALGRVTAREARAVGVHVTFGPVLDVNSNPANPIINTRSFGEDPEAVARLGRAYVRGAREGGLLTTAKHFPGHGDTETDSHLGLPTIRADRARLDAVELLPYRAAVLEGIDGIMTAHIAAVGILGSDAPPATLSPYFMTELLRRELGFRGVLFTDALDMGGVVSRYGDAEAAVLSVEAGADVLLMPRDVRGAIDAVAAAVRSGRLPEARIDASVRRILREKARAGLARARLVPLDSVDRVVGVRAHTDLARLVAERSLTLARDARGLVPLAPAARRLLVVTYAEEYDPVAGRVFARALAGRGRAVDAARVDPRTTAAEFAALRARADSADVVVVSVFAAWLDRAGFIGARGGLSEFVQALAKAGTPVVAVSFGTPYLLSSFPDVPAYLLAWGGADASQEAAARALLGEAPITGRLPVSLPPYHARGEGIQRPAAASLARQ
ncbi:MAG TPA: glycoside hydrolase family 3 N-terminal domain-containing protein [Longimicrobium sp.]|jgi:beta-N-acetylhexosaminidase